MRTQLANAANKTAYTIKKFNKKLWRFVIAFLRWSDEILLTPLRNVMVFGREQFDASIQSSPALSFTTLAIAVVSFPLELGGYIYNKLRRKKAISLKAVENALEKELATSQKQLKKLQEGQSEQASSGLHTESMHKIYESALNPAAPEHNIEAKRKLLDSIFNAHSQFTQRYSRFGLEGTNATVTLYRKSSSTLSTPTSASSGSLDVITPDAKAIQPNAQDTTKPLPLWRRFYKRVNDKLEKLWATSAWQSFSLYSMFYWIAWMFAIVLTQGRAATSLPLPPAIMFAVPAIIPVLYATLNGIRAGLNWLAKRLLNKQVPATPTESVAIVDKSKTAKSDANRLLSLFHARSSREISRAAIAESKDEITKKLHTLVPNMAEPQELSTTPAAGLNASDSTSTVSEDDPAALKRLKGGKWRKIFSGTLIGVVYGFVWSIFTAWPINDFLANVFNVAVAGPIGVITTFSIAAFLSLCYGVYNGLKAADEREVLAEKIQNDSLKEAKKSIAKHSKTIEESEQALAKVNREIARLYQQLPADKKAGLPLDSLLLKPVVPYEEGEDTLSRTFAQSNHFTWLKKAYGRIRSFVAGVGTGSVVIRLLFTGASFGLLFAHPPGAVILAIALCAGVAYGLFRAYTYHKDRQQARDQNFLAGLEDQQQILGLKAEEYEQRLTAANEIKTRLANAVNTLKQNNATAPSTAKPSNPAQCFWLTYRLGSIATWIVGCFVHKKKTSSATSQQPEAVPLLGDAPEMVQTTARRPSLSI